VAGQLILALSVTMAAVALAAVAWLVVRFWIITRHGGVVECGLRLMTDAKWRHGVAEYQRNQLCWRLSVGVRLRPAACFPRAGLRIVRSRPPSAAEADRFGPEVVIAECEIRHARPAGPPGVQSIELAMSQSALTGLLSWLEASPEFHLRAG
jgi:Protein of unknown function (DUF2550)